MAGWGSVSNFEDLPPGLMEAEVRVLGLDVCNSSWRGQLSPTMVCTQSGDRRRRGFCSVRYSLSVPPTYHMGGPRPTEKGQSWAEPWEPSPAYPRPDHVWLCCAQRATDLCIYKQDPVQAVTDLQEGAPAPNTLALVQRKKLSLEDLLF